MWITAATCLLVTGVAFANNSSHSGKPMTGMLSGSSEIPGPGDPDGNGMAWLTFNPGQEMICVSLEVTGIATATAAHIHEGSSDVAGPVVVGLPTPDGTGIAKGCVELSRDKILDIMHNADEYYVNVHNAEYPAGALRGQLEK